MGIDVRYLKEKVIEKNTTLDAVAHSIGMDRTTLYRKLRSGASSLTVSDARGISDFLGLSFEETLRIFWCHGTAV